MKRFCTLILVVLVISILSLNAFAAIPNEQTIEEKDGYMYMTKVFELDPSASPDQLEEEPFELLGYRYSLFSITKDENEFHDSKEYSEIVFLETSTKDMEKILGELQPSIQYDENGYSGSLRLNHTSISTEASGHSSRYYSVNDTKTINNLERNDPSLIPKSTDKNGVNLALGNVQWSVESVDEDGEPLSYTAVAAYSGGYTGQVANGYVTTAEYSGTIYKGGIASITYIVTYVGEKIKSEPTPTPKPTPTPVPTVKPEPIEEIEVISPTIPVEVWIYGFMGLLALIALVKTIIVNKRNVNIYARSDDSEEYERIAKRRLRKSDPVIEVSRLYTPNGVLVIEIAARTARRLFGRLIRINVKGGSRTHLVEQTGRDNYWFSVTTGGNALPQTDVTENEE